jgi:hypothetical protein
VEAAERKGWGDREDAICSMPATNTVAADEPGMEVRAKGASGEK